MNRICQLNAASDLPSPVKRKTSSRCGSRTRTPTKKQRRENEQDMADQPDNTQEELMSERQKELSERLARLERVLEQSSKAKVNYPRRVSASFKSNFSILLSGTMLKQVQQTIMNIIQQPTIKDISAIRKRFVL